MSDTDRDLEARIASVPREAEPGRDLWPVVARAIDSPRTKNGRRLVPRVPLQIAAALALFAGGVLVGQRWGEAPRSTAPVPTPAGAFGTAAEVQRAGTAYVSALSRLDASAGPIERDQGVDAALSALQGAAYELVRLRPDDPQAGRILYTVSEARAEGDGPTVRF